MNRCRICEGRDLRLFYTQGSRGEFRFYRCADCKLVSYDLAAGLDQEKYAVTYPDPFDESSKTNLLQGETHSFIRRHFPTPGRLLDIGCGNGRLLHLARLDGWTVKGLEISNFLARCTADRLGIEVLDANFLQYEPPPGEQHELVVLRHVLEHLPDPIAALTRIHRLLAPGGHALLEFPNIDGFDLQVKRLLDRVGLHRKRYAENYRPGHCNEFCRASFRRLAERTGFELVIWQTYSHRALLSLLYARLPIGNKARALIRKTRPAF